MKKLALISLLFLPTMFAWPQVAKQENPLVLRHVTVIDTATGTEQADNTVVIQGERIVDMGRTDKVHFPADSHVVDASGKFLIPGLWDMNVFWYDPKEYLPLFIANGVTGIREVLGYAEHYEFRKQIEAGQLLGPRMVIGSRWIDAPGGPSDPNDKALIFLTSDTEARRAVVENQRFGADFLELGGLEGLSRDVFFALADEAKKRRIPLEGHVPISVSMTEASNAGLKVIDVLPAVPNDDVGILAATSSREADVRKSWQEALAKALASTESDTFDTLRSGSDFQARMKLALQTYDQQKAEGLTAILKGNHTWFCPTLIGQQHSTFVFDDPAIAGDPRLKYISPAERSWFKDENGYRPKNSSGEDNAVWKQASQRYFQVVGAMGKAGVKLLAGSTTEEPLLSIPGFSLHDDLSLLVQAGLTPVEALQTATLNPARYMGKEQDFGTVAQGKVADLVLLDANPLQDINNTRRIDAVVYQGKLYPRSSLDTMLARIEKLGTRKSIGDTLEPIMKEKGVEATIRQYRELKSSQPDAYDFEDKYELSSLCHIMLRGKNFKDAIPICKFNAQLFPDSWWAFDEVAAAYMGAGQKQLAIKNYTTSLTLDPLNQNAALKLKQLKSQ